MEHSIGKLIIRDTEIISIPLLNPWPLFSK